MLISCASKLLIGGLYKGWKQVGEVCSDTTVSQRSLSLPWCQAEILQTLDCDSCQSNSDECQLVKHHCALLYVAVLNFAHLSQKTANFRHLTASQHNFVQKQWEGSMQSSQGFTSYCL